MCTTYVNSLMITKSDVEGVSYLPFYLQHICLPNRNHSVQWPRGRVPFHQLWGGGLLHRQCVLPLSMVSSTSVKQTILLSMFAVPWKNRWAYHIITWSGSIVSLSIFFISISRSTFILLLLITVWKTSIFFCKGEWTVHVIILEKIFYSKSS